MFGKSVKEIREGNIERRERIARVKQKKKEKAAGQAPIDAEAKKVQEELGVSYEDALEYVKDERKSAKRKETFRGAVNFMSQVGQLAREDTARRYGAPKAERKETHQERQITPLTGFPVRRVKFPGMK